MTKEQFIEKAKQVHDDKYDYSCVQYKNNKTKINIFCNNCKKYFLQIPNSHLSGHGCPFCCNKKPKITKEQFIEKAKQVHDDKYDYSLVNYTGIFNKVKIICPKHGLFEQSAKHHLEGMTGCPKCKKENMNFILSRTEEEFINKSKKIHLNYYNYSNVKYYNELTKVKIICPKHGLFEQIPKIHLLGCGCPKCKSSNGEKDIRNYLNNNKIVFEEQKTFKNLKFKKNLRYDFYLPQYNLLIEYNGIQHYKWIKYFNKTYKDWLKRKHCDWLKRKFAKDNNLNFIVIKFNDDIFLKLKEKINEL